MTVFLTSKWLKPGIFSTLDKFSVVALGFISFFILARVLSKDEFGVWVLFISISSIVETLRAGFIKPPFIAFLGTSYGMERSRTGSAALLLNFVYSILVSALIFYLAYPLELFFSAAPLGDLLRLYAITNLVFIAFSHFENLMQANMDFKGSFLGNFLRSLVQVVGISLMALLGIEIELIYLAALNLVGSVLSTGVCLYYGWYLKHDLILPQTHKLKEMLKFAKYSFGTNLGALSIRNMDSLMLGRMISTESVAAYNPAIRISNLVEIPTLTVASVVFPKMAQKFDPSNYQYTNQLYEKSLGILMGIMIPLCLIMFFFSDILVLLIAGANYADSGSLLKIAAFYTLFIPFGRQFGILLDAMRKPELNFYFILGTAIVNVMLHYWLISKWGTVGAAYGTLFTFFLRFLAQQVLLYYLYGIRTVQVFKNIFSVYNEGFVWIRGHFYKN